MVAYYGAKDVPGSNFIGPVVPDEEVFAADKVTAVGQVSGRGRVCVGVQEWVSMVSIGLASKVVVWAASHWPCGA